MKFIRKIKIEIGIFLFVVLSIVVFFMYAQIRNVQSITFLEQQVGVLEGVDAQLADIEKTLETLAGIEKELATANCLTRANGDSEKVALCE